MKYKLIIFDLDGTILNTLEDLMNSANYALEKNGYPKRSLQEIRSFVGNGIVRLMQRAVPAGTGAAESERVLQDFKEHYAEHCADLTRPYDGIRELLEDLKKRGCQTAVVSNKADFAVQELCKQYFPKQFDIAAGETERIQRKPAPDMVFEVLKRMQIKKEEAIYIGDSEVDLATAKNAGMDILSVTWGFRDRTELETQGAVLFAESPQRVISILEQE